MSRSPIDCKIYLRTGREYLSKIIRKASWSPRHARETRSAELFITDPANAPGRPSRLISRAASRFICSGVLVSPRAERFQDFCTCGNRNLNGSGIGGVPIIRPRARHQKLTSGGESRPQADLLGELRRYAAFKVLRSTSNRRTVERKL